MRRHYTNYFRGLPNFKEHRMKLVTERDPAPAPRAQGPRFPTLPSTIFNPTAMIRIGHIRHRLFTCR